ncbi:MAG: hypothetical protein H0T84_02890 [Tatlockia sp.]|nr:hypothetical protein [Tatlockia sp.]
MIDIKGINKAVLVAALFNNSKPLAAQSNCLMTVPDAQEYLDEGQTYFDYLIDRIMKIDVSGDTMYDRYNGFGAANRVVETIRKAPTEEFKLDDEEISVSSISIFK